MKEWDECITVLGDTTPELMRGMGDYEDGEPEDGRQISVSACLEISISIHRREELQSLGLRQRSGNQILPTTHT